MSESQQRHPLADNMSDSFDTIRNAKKAAERGGGDFFDYLPTAVHRGPLEAVVLQILIRIKYLFSTWFLLKPIFASALSAYPSFLRPKGIPEVDYLTLFGIRMLWILMPHLRGNKLLFYVLIKLRIAHLMNWMFLALQRRIARIMEESDFAWEKVRGMPVPEFDWKNRNPDEFFKTFVERPHPVILRGFSEGSKLVQDYTFDKVIETFGEETVLLTNRKKDGYEGKLKEVLNPKIYMHNSEVLFNKYPEIWEAVDTKRLDPYMRKQCGYAQLFVGLQGTGTPFHNAASVNMFYMVDGTKKWYLIDPSDSYICGPMFKAGTGAAANLVLFPDEYDESIFPAFKYCPYFEVDMQPGDVLFIPSWWIHAIRNTSEKTVAVATRWLAEGAVGTNLTTPEEDYDIHRIASMTFLTGMDSFGMLHQTLRDPSPKFDEHSTTRERRSRFTAQTTAMAKGEVVIDDWRPIF